MPRAPLTARDELAPEALERLPAPAPAAARPVLVGERDCPAVDALLRRVEENRAVEGGQAPCERCRYVIRIGRDLAEVCAYGRRPTIWSA